MATPDDFLRVANAQYGIGENPPGSNRNKFTAWYGVVGPWCAMFQSWCFAQVGMGHIRTAWCDTLIQNAKNGTWGTWVNQYDRIQPGDLAIFDWDGGFSDHVAAVNRVLAEGRWESIEGNWGDRVTRVTRGRENILGFFRPRWDPAVTPPPMPPAGSATREQIKKYQFMLDVWLSHNKEPLIEVDGVVGPATRDATKRFQKFANGMYALAGKTTRLAEDGEIGPATGPVLAWWANALSHPKPTRLPVPSGNPLLHVGSPSSDSVRQLQTALNRVMGTNLMIDGDFGQQTKSALISYQALRRLTPDGAYGPLTAKRLKAEPKLTN